MSPIPINEHPASALRRLEQRARKRFGQNFLVDPSVAGRIATLSRAGEGDRVLEIGPGLGQLTRALLATGADLTAVELDRDLAAFLKEELPELSLHQGDAMRVDLDLVAPGDGWIACANLPYNVATPLLVRLLEDGRFSRMVLMFQLEVAQRLIANPHTAAYGSLSVFVQAWSRPWIGFTLEPGAFHPKPKVRSAVVVLQPRETPKTGGADPRLFRRVVRAGFSQRRKTLLNSLSSAFERDVVRGALEATGGSGRRAQELSLEGWGELAVAVEAQLG